MLRDGFRPASVRQILDFVYTVLIDESLGMASLFEVKKAIDGKIREVFPDRETWGMDADVLDGIPQAAMRLTEQGVWVPREADVD